MTEQHAVTDAEVDDLILLMREAASAYIAGEMRRYFDLMRHAVDFTLMSPFGGEVTRESVASNSAARLAELEDFFKGGQCNLEVVETYASGDLVVLVVVERQHGLVGHLPPQDWSLRVTLVFRREHGVWRLVHRHADPLVHPITFDELAELSRG
jgi:ketosteroid isomerase-like protein